MRNQPTFRYDDLPTRFVARAVAPDIDALLWMRMRRRIETQIGLTVTDPRQAFSVSSVSSVA